MNRSERAGDGGVEKYVRGSSLLLVGKIGAAAIALLTQIIIVRTLPKDEFGLFAYGLSLASFIETIGTLGLDRGVSRFVPMYDEREDRDRALGTIVGVFGVVGATLSLAFIALGIVRWASDGEYLGTGQSVVLILAFLAPVQAADTVLTNLFATIGDPKAIFFRRFLLTPLFRLTIVLLLVLRDDGSVFLATGYLVTGLIGAALYGALCVRALRQHGILDRGRIRTMRFPMSELLLFSVPLFSTDLVAILFSSVDALLVNRFHGPAEVAELRSVQPVIRMNQLVLASFGIMFMPMVARLFARSDIESIRELYWRTATWVAVLSYPGFLVGFVVAAPVTETLFGTQYADAAPIMAILSLGYFLNAALGYNGVTLNVFGHVRPVVVLNLVTVALNVVLSLALIPRYGAIGAAWSTLATLVFQNLARHTVLVRRVDVPVMARESLPVYGAIVVTAAIAITIQRLLDPNLIVALGVIAASWIAVVAVARRHLDIARAFPALARVPLLRSTGRRG